MLKRMLFILMISLAVFAKNSPKINGFFIQPILGYGIADYTMQFGTQEYYDDWVKSIADIGASMLFYQWVSHFEANQDWFSTAYGGAASADFCYYRPNLNEISNIPVQSWMPAINAWTQSNVSPIQRVLDAGEKNEVDIWLGLYLNEDGTHTTYNWWDAVNNNEISAADSAIFRYHVERSVDLVRDLVEQYGNHPALGGFYYPVEIANLGFENEENWDLLAWVLDSVAVEVDKLSGKRLAISPFFNTALTPAEEWGEMWDYALGKLQTKNLVIMLQDGVGVEPQTIDRIEPFYRAVSDACKKHGIAFWANSELFHNPSGDRMASGSQPTDIEILLEQMTIEKEFTDTFVCFSYMSLDPYVENIGYENYEKEARTKLYNDYKEYYNSIKNETPTVIPERKMSLKNQNISVIGNKISLPKFDKPVSYSLISPSGKIVLNGVAEKEKIISAPVATGIYILMLGIAEKAPLRQKIFLQNNTQSTINYQLR